MNCPYDKSNENALAKAQEVFWQQIQIQPATTEPDSTPKEKSQLDSEQSTSQNNSHRDAEATTQNKGYSFYSAREFYDDIETESYLIDGHIQKEALQMMYGEPGCGKTFTASDIAYSISCDAISSWHGRYIEEHGDVVYFVGESIKGTKRRFRGWCVHNGVQPEQTRIHFCDEGFKLDDDAPEHCIDTTIAEIRKICDKPVFIVIDTLNVFMNGDENKTVDANKFIDACRRLIREFSCTVLIIHHVGVNPEAKNRGRGSSVFKGNMDIETQVTKNDEGIITLRQSKNKEAPKEPPLNLKLSAIPIPNCFDKHGRPITTCVIETCESQNTANESEPKEKFSQYEQTAIKTFKEAVERNGIKITDDETQHELAAVYLEDWRKVSYELSFKDNDNTKRREFNDGRKGLCEKKILIKKVIECADYYCLDLDDEIHIDQATRITVRIALGRSPNAQAAAEPEPLPDAQISLPIEPQHDNRAAQS